MAVDDDGNRSSSCAVHVKKMRMRMMRMLVHICFILISSTSFFGGLVGVLKPPSAGRISYFVHAQSSSFLPTRKKKGEFVFVPDSGTWEEAAEGCEEMGGVLAGVHSKEEQKTIEKLLDGAKEIAVWIGYYSDRKKEGTGCCEVLNFRNNVWNPKVYYCDTLLPYVCLMKDWKKKTSVTANVKEEEDPRKLCGTSWMARDAYCFAREVAKVYEEEEEKKEEEKEKEKKEKKGSSTSKKKKTGKKDDDEDYDGDDYDDSRRRRRLLQNNDDDNDNDNDGFPADVLESCSKSAKKQLLKPTPETNPNTVKCNWTEIACAYKEKADDDTPIGCARPMSVRVKKTRDRDDDEADDDEEDEGDNNNRTSISTNTSLVSRLRSAVLRLRKTDGSLRRQPQTKTAPSGVTGRLDLQTLRTVRAGLQTMVEPAQEPEGGGDDDGEADLDEDEENDAGGISTLLDLQQYLRERLATRTTPTRPTLLDAADVQPLFTGR